MKTDDLLRVAMIPALCQVCGGPAFGACRNCGRTTCDRHLTASHVCEACARGLR